MSRELQRRGPIGYSRGGSEARDRRNSDAAASYLEVAAGVADVSLNKIPLTGPENALVGLVRRLDALQTAHNNLLASLRDGQVINRDQPR